MYTPVDMRKLQDRLDAISNSKVEEIKVEAVTTKAAPEVEQVELAQPDSKGTSQVLGIK